MNYQPTFQPQTKDSQNATAEKALRARSLASALSRAGN